MNTLILYYQRFLTLNIKTVKTEFFLLKHLKLNTLMNKETKRCTYEKHVYQFLRKEREFTLKAGCP